LAELRRQVVVEERDTPNASRSVIAGRLWPADLSFATERRTNVGNMYEESRVYPLSPDDTFECCLSALQPTGLRVEAKDPINKRIKAASPFSLWATRVRCEIQIAAEAQDRSRVWARVYPLAALGNRALVGGGKKATEKGSLFLSQLDSEAWQLRAFLDREIASRSADPSMG